MSMLIFELENKVRMHNVRSGREVLFCDGAIDDVTVRSDVGVGDADDVGVGGDGKDAVAVFD